MKADAVHHSKGNNTMARRTQKEINGDLEKLNQLTESRELDEALALVERLNKEAAGMGVTSAFLNWQTAIVYDYRGQAELAFSHIQTALALDPFVRPFFDSKEIIVTRIRGMLADTKWKADDEATPRLWKMLSQAGEADDATHLALARYHLATGNAPEALRVVDALTVLRPALRDAWLLKAEIGTKLNDAGMAERARVEAAGLEGMAVPFAVAAAARG